MEWAFPSLTLGQPHYHSPMNPLMKKNLISIFRFCSNNNVFVAFSPSSFYVKDFCMGAMHYKEWLKMVFMSGCIHHQHLSTIAFSLIKVPVNQ